MIVGIFIDRGSKRIAVVAQGGRESHDLRKRVDRLPREESCVLGRSWTDVKAKRRKSVGS